MIAREEENMAQVEVKVFGVLRLEMGIQSMTLRCEKVGEVIPQLNRQAQTKVPIRARDVALYLNGAPCTRQSVSLTDGDEIWIMSPAAGG